MFYFLKIYIYTTYTGSRFFWHEKMGEEASLQEIETWSYPKRTRVNNKCGRLVAFSAGEENPHGAESIGFGNGANDDQKFEVHAAGALMNNGEGEYDTIEKGGSKWSEHARWALTNWFSSDDRFTRVEKDVFSQRLGFEKGYSVDPWGEEMLNWLEKEEWKKITK